MQSFILAAGHGTRLAPLTHILPKPLMPIFQKPLVAHIMDSHYAAGVRRFIVNTSAHDLMWERAFPEETYRDCPVIFSHEPEPLDSGGGIRQIIPLIDCAEPLIIHNGDILTDIPLDELMAEHRRSGHALTLALRSVDGKKNVGFDPATGRITDVRHALGVDAGSYQFTGVYIIDPSVFERFPRVEEARSFSIVPFWLELIAQGRAGGVVFDWVNWNEIGSPEQYLSAVLALNSRERVHPTAQINLNASLCEDCVVGKDAFIHADAHLVDCIVWPRTHVEAGNYRRCILTPRIKVQV